MSIFEQVKKYQENEQNRNSGEYSLLLQSILKNGTLTDKQLADLPTLLLRLGLSKDDFDRDVKNIEQLTILLNSVGGAKEQTAVKEWNEAREKYLAWYQINLKTLQIMWEEQNANIKTAQIKAGAIGRLRNDYEEIRHFKTKVSPRVSAFVPDSIDANLKQLPTDRSNNIGWSNLFEDLQPNLRPKDKSGGI